MKTVASKIKTVAVAAAIVAGFLAPVKARQGLQAARRR